MKHMTRMAGAIALASLSCATQATTIDFSDYDHFRHARGEPEYTTTVEGYTVTLKAWVDTGQWTPNPISGIAFDKLLHDSYYLDLKWDTNDGIGINVRDEGHWKDRYENYDNNEIEGDEVLEVRFDRPVYLESILIDNLFYEKRGGDRYQEMGFYQIGQGAPVKFQAPADKDLDELVSFPVGAVVSDSIYFWAPGKLGDNERHEFALHAMDVSPAPVPLPPALWLLGSGLALLTGLGRRKPS